MPGHSCIIICAVYVLFIIDVGPQKATSASVAKESPDMEDL